MKQFVQSVVMIAAVSGLVSVSYGAGDKKTAPTGHETMPPAAGDMAGTPQGKCKGWFDGKAMTKAMTEESCKTEHTKTADFCGKAATNCGWTKSM